MGLKVLNVLAKAVAKKAYVAPKMEVRTLESLGLKMKKSTDNIVKLGQELRKPALSYNTDAITGEIGYIEHGYSEILSGIQYERQITQEVLSQTFNQPFIKSIKINGIKIPCPVVDTAGIKCPLQKYKIIEKDNFTFIQFYNDITPFGQPVPLIQDSERIKYIKYMLEKLQKNEIVLQKDFCGFKIPKNTTPVLVEYGENSSALFFKNAKEQPVRKILLDSDGKPKEYTDYFYFKDDRGEFFQYATAAESQSTYFDTRAASRYVLNDNGTVKLMENTSTAVRHHFGQILEPVHTRIITRYTGGGKVWEDLTISSGNKQFQRSFIYSSKTGNRYQMDGVCFNLTEDEILLIKSDPYLASRYYNDLIDVARTEKFNALKAQKVNDKKTHISFIIPEDFRQNGYYHRLDRDSGIINITPFEGYASNLKKWITGTLHHESRHAKQHDLIQKLKANELFGEDKAKAQQYAYEFQHYISPDKDLEGYLAQTIEHEAHNIGNNIRNQFNQHAHNINSIFGVA